MPPNWPSILSPPHFIARPLTRFKSTNLFPKIVQRNLIIFCKGGPGVPPLALARFSFDFFIYMLNWKVTQTSSCKCSTKCSHYMFLTFCCISEMTFNRDLGIELDTMQSELQSHVSCINRAFSVLEARVSAWQLRRQEILRTEFKKILVKLKERDTVS